MFSYIRLRHSAFGILEIELWYSPFGILEIGLRLRLRLSFGLRLVFSSTLCFGLQSICRPSGSRMQASVRKSIANHLCLSFDVLGFRSLGMDNHSLDILLDQINSKQPIIIILGSSVVRFATDSWVSIIYGYVQAASRGLRHKVYHNITIIYSFYL